MKTPATLLALALSVSTSAQVGIGTTTPDTTSILDVSSSTKAIGAFRPLR